MHKIPRINHQFDLRAATIILSSSEEAMIRPDAVLSAILKVTCIMLGEPDAQWYVLPMIQQVEGYVLSLHNINL